MVPLESAISLFLGGCFTTLLVVLPRVPLIPQKLGIHLHQLPTTQTHKFIYFVKKSIIKLPENK